MLIVFLGPPGVGKGTQSKRLTCALRIAHLSTGDILREFKLQETELGQRVANYIDSGCLVPDEIITELVSQRLQADDCRNGCLLDGFPRTVVQAKMLQDQGRTVDLAVELKANDEELTRRLTQRSGIEGRPDDTPQTVAKRLNIYHEQTSPLVNFYANLNCLVTVNGLGTPDEVYARIEQVVAHNRRSNQ